MSTSSIAGFSVHPPLQPSSASRFSMNHPAANRISPTASLLPAPCNLQPVSRLLFFRLLPRTNAALLRTNPAFLLTNAALLRTSDLPSLQTSSPFVRRSAALLDSIAALADTTDLPWFLIRTLGYQGTAPATRLISIRAPKEEVSNAVQPKAKASSFSKPTAESDCTPRGKVGPIATAWSCSSNHAMNDDCSNPGRRCWLIQ